MFKTYLQSLKNSLRYALIFLASFSIGGILIYVVAFFLWEGLSVSPAIIVIGAPSAVTFIVSVSTRQDYDAIAKAYRQSCDSKKLHIGRDLKRMICSKEFWIEFFVFCHYLAALCIVGGPIIFSNVVEGIFIAIGAALLYLALNAGSWLLVHKKYLDTKVI